MPTPAVTSSRQIQADSCRAKAFALLEKDIFTREDSARAESLLALAAQLDMAGKASALRSASLTESEASMGWRTPRTRRLDSTRADFWTVVRGGIHALDTDDPARRALAVGVDSAGGYLVPASLSDQIYSMMAGIDKLFDPAVTTIITTGDGGSFSIPLDNDIAGAGGAIVAENIVFAEAQDIAFEVLALSKCPTWRADMLRASTELVQDVGYDLESYLADKFSKRLAKCIGASLYTTLIGAATQGVSAGATAITPENIFDLVDSVDDAYLGRKCCWLMRRSTLNYLRKLKTTGGNYAFELDRDAEGNFLLCNFPVRISPSVAAIATTAKSVVFGDLSRFVVRTVADGMKLRVLRERYITQGQYAFLMWARVHGGLAKFSTADSPVKYLLHA